MAGCLCFPVPPSEGNPPLPTLEPVSISYGGLLTRLDILVNLVADRRGLALDLQGRLAAAEARLLAEALELDRRPGPAPRDLAAVELLRGLAEAVGLLRDRGDRIEATTLRHPWAQLDADLRAGLVYAAWCHRVPWAEMLRDAPEPHVRTLRDARSSVLRLLFELPAGWTSTWRVSPPPSPTASACPTRRGSPTPSSPSSSIRWSRSARPTSPRHTPPRPAAAASASPPGPSSAPP